MRCGRTERWLPIRPNCSHDCRHAFASEHLNNNTPFSASCSMGDMGIHDATDRTIFVDVDSVLRRVYGKAKQGAAVGHTKLGG